MVYTARLSKKEIMTVKLHADIKYQTASQDIFMSQLL